MRRLLILCCLGLTLVWLGPASAQPQGANKNGRIEAEPPGTMSEGAAEAQKIMERALPFRDGQMLRYYDGDGGYLGYARRRALNIQFYGPDGTYLGRAQRVTQALTRYYDPRDAYIGRRVNQRLTVDTVVTNNRGFDAAGGPGGKAKY